MQNLLTSHPLAQTLPSWAWKKDLKYGKHAADPSIGVSVSDISYQGDSSYGSVGGSQPDSECLQLTTTDSKRSMTSLGFKTGVLQQKYRIKYRFLDQI